VRALVAENRMYKEKDSFKSHHSNMHLIDYDLIIRAIVIKKFMLLNLFGPPRKNLILAHHLSRLVKVRKKKLNLLLMFPSAIIFLLIA
jgi:hypothetical protein